MTLVPPCSSDEDSAPPKTADMSDTSSTSPLSPRRRMRWVVLALIALVSVGVVWIDATRDNWGHEQLSTEFATHTKNASGWSRSGNAPRVEAGAVWSQAGVVRYRATAIQPRHMAVSIQALWPAKPTSSSPFLTITWFDPEAPRSNHTRSADISVGLSHHVIKGQGRMVSSMRVKQRVVSWQVFDEPIQGEIALRAQLDGNALSLVINGRPAGNFTAASLSSRYALEVAFNEGVGLRTGAIHHKSLAKHYSAQAMADELFELQHYDEAARYYRALISDSPSNKDTLVYQLGLCQWQAKRRQHALETWAAIHDPTLASLVSLYAIRLQYQSDKGNALNTITRDIGSIANASPALRQAWLVLLQDLMIQEANVTSIYYRTLNELAQSYFGEVRLDL